MKIVEQGISPANSMKLYDLLLDPKKSFKLKVELCAYVEGLEDLRNLCYLLEGDGTDVCFKVFGRIKAFQDLYPGGAMKTLPSTNRAIMEAIEWALKPTTEGGGGFQAPAPNTPPLCPPRTVANIRGVARSTVVNERPRRRAAIEAVHDAVFSGETDVQRRRRQAALLKAQEDAAIKAATEAALEREAEKQADAPPLSLEQWQAHIISIVGPCISYINTRLNDPSGDRFEALQLFEGASILDPSVAKTTRHDDVMPKPEKLRCYPALNKVGPENIVDRLKLGYSAFRQNAMRVPQESDYKKHSAAIMSWHYKLFLRLDKELCEDSRARKSCRYC